MSEKLKKNDFIDEVSERCHVNKKDVAIVIDETFEYIKDCLKENKEVSVTNFAIFTPITRKARTGTDPRNGQEITLEERKSVLLKLSKNFKKELNK